MRQLYLYCALLLSVGLTAQTTYTLPAQGDLIIEDCSGILYDSGGPDGDYSNDELSNVLITGSSGDALALTFTSFEVENFFDNLTIYDGTSFDSPIIGVYTGNNLPNDGAQIVLSGRNCLLVFTSDYSVTRPGFAMNFECIDFIDPPVAAATFPSLSCTGTVAFSDASTLFPTSWRWDFGDGTTSTERNPTHTYTTPGIYDIELTACNDNGCDTFLASQALTFDPESFACTNGIDIPSFGIDTSTLCSGVLYDNGGVDGNYEEGSSGQFIIAPPGATSITLTFTGFDLGNLTNNHDILYIFDASGENGHGQFLASYTGNMLPNGGQSITFDVGALGIIFYSDHLANFSGFELIWEANGSAIPPTAAISASATTIPFGTSVQFTDNSTENPGGWQWDFGDGNTSTQQNPSHTYNQAGTFSVTLSVSNCAGEDTSESVVITVEEPPAVTANPGSFSVELDAGTSTTETLNLCNIGTGSLVSTFTTTGGSPQAGYLLEFTSFTNGGDFVWSILDSDFQVVAEFNQSLEAGTTYSEMVSGLEPFAEYYFVITNSEEGIVTFDDLTITDLGSGVAFFIGSFEFIADQIYIFPTPQSGINGALTWLNIEENSNPLAADACEDLTITFDATDLIDGTYEGTIVITTNDPNNPTITIPVTLIVNGTPELTISANDLDFGEVQVGGSATLDFTLENTGTAAVDIAGLSSTDTRFEVDATDELTLQPNTSRTVSVTFAPDAVADFSETLVLVNNAGADVPVTLTGTGIAAPSLTVNPTNFTVELFSGQDTTLQVTVGNVGDAPLTYDITPFSNTTGFVFNFTTDAWGQEFSWYVLNSSGEIVLSSEGTFYNSNTDYSVPLTGLSSGETYVLQLLDSFGDGALPNYSITDALSGQVVAEGAFVGDLFFQEVAIGSPATEFASISPTSGTVAINSTNELAIDIDATGLSTGVYDLRFVINTNDPLQPTAMVTVRLFVIAPVEAGIDAPSLVCGTLPINFRDASINVPTSWLWDFGDGTTSTEQNPSHTYAESGTYTISLEVCNALGCSTAQLDNFVEVNLDCFTANVPASHGNLTVEVCEGTIYDSGGPTGNYLEGNLSSIVIAPPGATSVSITFSEFNYEEHVDRLIIYDGFPGTGAVLGFFTGTELQGQTLQSTTGVLTIQEYTDHFTNLSGFAATFTCESDIEPPTAEFSLADTVWCINESVAFEDESTGSPDSWFWEFGDGFTSNEQNPTNMYAEAGTYTVTLTVCNTEGCNTLIREVEIVIDPDCILEDMPVNDKQTIVSCNGTLYDSGGPNENYVDDNASFTTISSTGGPITLEFIEFNMGVNNDNVTIIDGATLDGPVIGVFTGNTLPEPITSSGSVITIVENTDLIINESGYQINYSCEDVQALVSGGITVENAEICDGKRTFAVATNSTIDTWLWQFGDGQTSTEANPEHEFPHNGAYAISLTACANGDCETVETMIYSNKLTPEIDAPETVAVGQEVQLHGLTEEATHWSWDFGNGEVSDHHAPTTSYDEAGWYDIHVHLINMNVHETCDANHTHSLFVDGNLTNVAELETVALRVYPNPTTGIVNLAGLSDLEGDYTIRVASITGQILQTEPLNRTVSLAAFPAGLYVLEVLDEQQVIGRAKVVKE